MGQCLCKPSPLPYLPHNEQFFPTQMTELILAPAGQLIPEDSGAIDIKYMAAINDLFNTVNGLYDKLEEIDKLQKDGKSIKKPTRAFCKALKEIGELYARFLRLSDYAIDEYVQVRKDKACDGYQHWFLMKEAMKVLAKGNVFIVEDLKKRIDHQFTVTQKLFHDF
ncbi:hypothetical protein GCK72_016329 [Caenorhabditis remanei]|uniref:Uncharacterized protein n=1 Tax=Caenorhabditis remanei TaxID=31234 RepID=A0A6A5GZX9_CAERE|nr:hypothetical protein GCK72_016329 [Caenorhabditis remanei]KAF1759862.1 hypothetical protein GCK72_016329 [Caenorhabditis remanei]